MSHLLSVRVKCGRLQAAAGGGKSSGYNTLLSLSISGVEALTRPLSGTTPLWGQELNFNVQSPLEVLQVTLFNKGWFSKDALGQRTISLHDISFGEQNVEGRWYELLQPTPNGEEKTGHQVLLELHYDVEPGLSAKEVARHWKLEYIRAGGTEPVDPGSSEEQDWSGEEDEEDGGGEEEESGGSYDDEEGYTDDVEDGEEVERDGEYPYEDDGDVEYDEHGLAEDEREESDANSMNGASEQNHAASKSLPIPHHAGSLTRRMRAGQAASLSNPQIIEPEVDFEAGSSASCQSENDCSSTSREQPAAAAASNSVSTLPRLSSQRRPKFASHRRYRSGRRKDSGGRVVDDKEFDKDNDGMRRRTDAISEGSCSPYPNKAAGFLIRQPVGADYDEDDEEFVGEEQDTVGVLGTTSPPLTSPQDSISTTDVAVEVSEEPGDEYGDADSGGSATAATATAGTAGGGGGGGGGDGSEQGSQWAGVADTMFKTQSLPRDRESGVFQGQGESGGTQIIGMFQFQTAPTIIPRDRKSFVTKNANAQEAVRKRIALMKRRNVLLCNEQLQIHVYHKTIQALLYPLSDNKEHEVELVTFHKPAHCYECGSLLWGLAKQGMKCTACGIKCHRRCLELLNADCLQRAAERYARQGDVDKNRHFKRIMEEKINRRQKESSEVFEFIREVFNVPNQQHEEVMVNAKQSILEGLSVWSAKVKVTVIEATGLTAKDKATGTSDPYVTVQVGGEKLKTKVVPQNLNPKWNETFDFECHESSDRIKVRVWDQDRDIKAAIANALTKEPDDFLGQTIIEVYSLSGEMDVWYQLDRRCDRSAVSGSIHLRISVEVEGEEKKAPFHVQYTSLHETAFDFLDEGGDHLQMMRYCQAPDRSLLFFKKPAQDIIQEFALRYGIENIYQVMTHFSCLSLRYATAGMTQTLSKLLVLINGYFRDHATVTDMGDGSVRTTRQPGRFLASNFKKEKFVEVLDRLQENLIYDLKAYRDVYPAEQHDKLDELKSAIDLLTSIMFFRQKVLHDDLAYKAKDLVVECIQASLMSTFQMLREEVITFILQGGATEAVIAAAKAADTTIPKKIPCNEEKDQANALTYLFKLLELLGQLVEQDRDIYAKCIVQFRDVDIGQLSALFLWDLMFDDLSHQLESPEVIESCTTSDFINLLFKTKWFFEVYVAKFATDNQLEMSNSLHRIFSPFIRTWLMDMVEKFDDILKNALQKDKQRQFQPMSDILTHSTSVVDIFAAMIETLTVLRKIGCTDEDLQGDYDSLYAALVVRVLTTYTAVVKTHVSQRTPEPTEVCVLLNNVEQLRVRLEDLYKLMGGELIENTPAGNTLNDLQKVLKQDQDDLCVIIAQGLDSMILARVKNIPRMLAKFKTGGEPTDSEIQALIEPGFQVMEKRIKVLVHRNTSKSIVRRVLKELHRIMLTHLLQNVVLPPLSVIRAQSRDHNLLDLTTRQWKVLTKCLEGVQEFFHVKIGDESHGLKHSYMKACSERKRMDDALAMYTLSTEMLLSRFVLKEREQDKSAMEEPQGEVNIQVDIFETQAERKITVKVVSGSRLQWPTSVSGIFRPFVELTLFGPALVGGRRKQETKSKTKSSPMYNEVFSFTTSREYNIDVYELHVAVRDYCFGRKAPLVGVTTLPLRTVMKSTGSLMAHLDIGRNLAFTDVGSDILCVLAQRPDDDLAREFVTLKLETRTVDMS